MAAVKKEDLRIVFMGTPEFAVQSLKILVDNGYNVVGVITAVDKPAGRGRKIIQSDVKKYALENNLNILQPERLKYPDFISDLKELNANLQIVVAFRMLPEIIWDMPEYGTFNLHASLLPQYRGAAPINRAIMNGEKLTGITTFFLQHEIDTGNIILQEKVVIGDSDNAGVLHDKLMAKGGELVLRTVQSISSGRLKLINQKDLTNTDELLNEAPKIFKNDCRINWDSGLFEIYNHIRGLSPYPSSWTIMKQSDNLSINIKIYEVEFIKVSHEFTTGSLISDNKTYLKVSVKGGMISIKELQIAGKKRMNIADLLRGFKFEEGYIFE